MSNSLFCMSPVGGILLISDGRSLTELRLNASEAGAKAGAGDTVLYEARRWLDGYFSGKKPSPSELPLSLNVSPFTRVILELISSIPYGETATYGELAVKAAALRGAGRMSAQAVGGAAGGNPIPIIIPCHRVMGAGGAITGYRYGADMKLRLLGFEGVDTSGFSMPRERRKTT